MNNSQGYQTYDNPQLASIELGLGELPCIEETRNTIKFLLKKVDKMRVSDTLFFIKRDLNYMMVVIAKYHNNELTPLHLHERIINDIKAIGL